MYNKILYEYEMMKHERSNGTSEMHCLFKWGRHLSTTASTSAGWQPPNLRILLYFAFLIFSSIFNLFSSDNHLQFPSYFSYVTLTFTSILSCDNYNLCVIYLFLSILYHDNFTTKNKSCNICKTYFNA